MLMTAAATVAAALAPLAFAQPAQPGPSPDPRLEGTWIVTEADREQIPYPEILEAVVVFKGDTFTVERTGGRSKWFGHIKADPRAGNIDLVMEADTQVFPLKGEKWEGLYRFNGAVLEINTAQGHDWRPTEYATGYDLANLKLRRK